MKFCRLQKLADDKIALDKVHLPALNAFLLSLLSQVSRDTLSTHAYFVVSHLSFDHVALWALVCHTHQQQNQSARLSYLSQWILNKLSKFALLDAFIGDSRSKQALLLFFSYFFVPLQPFY